MGDVAKGFCVRCPHCGKRDLVVDLVDLSIGCDDCDHEIDRSELEQIARDVKRLLAWLDAAGEGEEKR